MAGDAVTPAKNTLENGRVVRRRVSKFPSADKENFNVFGGNVGENPKKSPLPVGYPRRPLHDITAVLQSLDDQKEASIRPRKPFTRSQMGLCSRNFELLETSGQTESETGWSKKSKGKGTCQTLKTTTTSMKTTRSVRLTVNIQMHDQENRDPNIHVVSEMKTKTVTSAEVECPCRNADLEVLLPTLLDPSKDKILSSSIEMTEAEVPRDKSLEESNVGAVAMRSTEESQHEVKPETSAAFSMDEVKEASAQTPKPKPVEVEKSNVILRTRNQHAQEQKKQKPLSSRSSVAKFR